ncbi:MAG: acyltransferase family protein [Acidobacteriaceae bacterium]
MIRRYPYSSPMAAHPAPTPRESTAAPLGKIDIVQGLRAVAVLLVVWTHSIIAVGYHSTTRQGAFFHLKSFGACGLDIFFVISGFIVSLVATRAATGNQSSAGTFLSRRFTRIFPLYWILTVVVILEAQLGRYPIRWHQVPWLPTLFLLPGWHCPVPPLVLSLGWSLLFEIYFYLVLALWMSVSPRHLARNTIAFLAIMVALGIIVGIRRPLLIIWANPIALEFLFGCLIAQAVTWVSATAPENRRGIPTQEARRVRAVGRCLAALGAIALAATIFTGYGSASEASSIMAGLDGWLRVALWGVPSGLLVLGAILWRPAMQSMAARVLVLLGDASYSIYLCTNPARSMVEHFWRLFGHWGGDVGVLLCLLACVVIGVLCYLAVERPIMRFFHNWYKRLPFSTGPGA